MNPRQLVAILCSLFITTVAAHAQAPARNNKPPRVGIFFTSPATDLRAYEEIFMEAMRELGWVEGSTVVYDRDPPKKDLLHPDDMRGHAATLVSRKPDVIWLLSTVNARAVLAETRTIPIVGAAVTNVVENGFVKSLARPGGNFTGIVNIGWELGDKRFQLLQEIMPNLKRVGVLISSKDENTRRELKLIEEAAVPRRVTVIPAVVEDASGVGGAFAHLAKNQAEAVLITHLPLFQRARKSILQIAAERRIPAVGHRTYFAEDGAVFAYSSILEEQLRRSAHLVDKVLKGVSPADIPVEQPTRFELVINLKSAKTLGLIIPNSLLIQADRRIQ